MTKQELCTSLNEVSETTELWHFDRSLIREDIGEFLLLKGNDKIVYWDAYSELDFHNTDILSAAESHLIIKWLDVDKNDRWWSKQDVKILGENNND